MRKIFSLPSRFIALVNSLKLNPVVQKELRGRMRGRRAYILLGLYTLLIAFFVEVLHVFLWQTTPPMYRDLEFRQFLGQATFWVVFAIEILLTAAIAPSLASGSISSERERQTLDLVRVSLLPTRDFVTGKLVSALAFAFLLIFAALPIQSLAFFLGGVGIAEVIVSLTLTIVTAVFFCTLGLFFSSLTKSTTVATASSYATILVSNLLFVAFYLLSDIRFSGLFGRATSWLLPSLNPFATALDALSSASSNNSLWFTELYLSTRVYLPSPWIMHILLYSLLTWILIKLSIRFIDQARN